MVSAEVLKKQILFEDVPVEMLDTLAASISELELKKGEALYAEGQQSKGVYLIRSGKVEVSKKTADGWKQRLAVFTPGHFFGELSIMEHRVHEADAEALEDTKLFLLPKPEFERIEKVNAQLALAIMKKISTVMSNNLRRMNQRFIDALINY